MKRYFLPWTLLAALLLVPHPAEAGTRYKVKVDSVPTGANIYLETRQADPVGTTPQVFRLEKGEYTFILEMKGYELLSRAVKIRKAATFAFKLTRKPEPAQLKVESAPGASADGAAVKINGKDVGKVPVPISLSQGRYLVEVVKDGFKPFRKWINVKQGEKKTMAVALVSAKPQIGTLLVHSSAPGAVIYLDGRKVDRAPALLQKLKPGKYVVEARAKGYQPRSVEVTVEADKVAKVTIALELTSAAKALGGGTIQVVAKPKRVEVFVDGKSKGLAPVKVLGLTPGSHHVEGRREGYVSDEKTVTVKKAEFKTIKLALKEKVPPKKTGALRVISPMSRVLVFIDGQLMGKTPLLKHQIVPGPHFVTLRKKGYEELIQTVEIKPGQIVEVKAVLVKEKGKAPASAPASQPGKAKEDGEGVAPPPPFGMSSYGAQLVGPWNFTADVSLGFAHFFEARLTAGLFYKSFFGIDAGVEFRTFGAMSEIGVHSKFRVLNISPFALAVLFDIGGGGGPSSRGTFYTNLGLSASMWFKKLVTFTARVYLNIYSDRLCPESMEPGEVKYCGNPTFAPDGKDANPRERFNGARLFLSAIVEVPVHKRVNLFGILEGAPGTSRWAYRDAFVEVMPENDASIYGRVGVTFKF